MAGHYLAWALVDPATTLRDWSRVSRAPVARVVIADDGDGPMPRLRQAQCGWLIRRGGADDQPALPLSL